MLLRSYATAALSACIMQKKKPQTHKFALATLYTKLINHSITRVFPGKSYITILPAIPTKGMTKADLPQLIEQTYEVMNSMYKESTQEALADHMESLKLD